MLSMLCVQPLDNVVIQRMPGSVFHVYQIRFQLLFCFVADGSAEVG